MRSAACLNLHHRAQRLIGGARKKKKLNGGSLQKQLVRPGEGHRRGPFNERGAVFWPAPDFGPVKGGRSRSHAVGLSAVLVSRWFSFIIFIHFRAQMNLLDSSDAPNFKNFSYILRTVILRCLGEYFACLQCVPLTGFHTIIAMYFKSRTEISKNRPVQQVELFAQILSNISRGRIDSILGAYAVYFRQQQCF